MRKSMVIMVVFLLIALIPLTAAAKGKENTESNEVKILKQEIKKLNMQMLDLVKSGKEGEIKNLKLDEKLRKLAANNPRVINYLVADVDIFNKEKFRQKIKEHEFGSILIGENNVFEAEYSSRDYIVMEDGSFAVVELKAQKKPEDSNMITPMDLNTKPLGDYFASTTLVLYHAAYPDTELKLNADFRLSMNGVSFINTSTSGTTAYFPNNVNPKSSNIGSPSSTTVVDSPIYAYGNYTYNLLGTNGVALYSQDYQAQISLTYKGTTPWPNPDYYVTYELGYQWN